MQTFLPYPSFWATAMVLDRQRLGKQRLEAKQIINILEGNTKSKAWIHHPAVLMWKGYTDCLKEYYNTICMEWRARGYQHNMGFYDVTDKIIWPWWLGDKDFHDSHKSNLMRKNPDHYSSYFVMRPDLPYVWPVRKQK